MAQRTKPDANQADIEAAVNLCPGCRFIDTHDVPRNLPELTGFPDGLIAVEGALTVICEDPRQVRALLADLPGVRIIEGGLVPAEIKTAAGTLRASQTLWGQMYGVAPLVLRTMDMVFRTFRGEVI